MSTIHPKYSTEMHQNTTFYAELNGEHAGECFMPLRSIVLEIWTREQRWKTDSFLVPLRSILRCELPPSRPQPLIPGASGRCAPQVRCKLIA